MVKLSWKKTFFLLKKLLFSLLDNANFIPIRFYIGNFLDLETTFLISRISNLLASHCFSTSKNNDFSASYFNSIDFNFDLSLIINLNLRLISPILNVKLRRSILKNGLLVYYLGHFSNFNFYLKHLSSSSKTLLSILEGKHWLNYKINKGSSTLVLVDDVISDLYNLNKNIFKIFSRNKVLLNTISSTNLNLSKFEVGLNNLVSTPLNKKCIDFLIGFDKSYIYSSFFKIYQGHHGDHNLSNADIILPSSFFIEKNSNYLNISGILSHGRKILPSIANSRDD